MIVAHGDPGEEVYRHAVTLTRPTDTLEELPPASPVASGPDPEGGQGGADLVARAPVVVELGENGEVLS
ncbi:hypothetical protein Vwe01_51810 [Micromonospora andamanensis]|nr:hypothetical protein Vwe01_51810 [Micromonospora andamanensis]